MKLPALVLAAAVLAAGSAAASDEEVFHLNLKDHRFTPDSLEVPANAKVRLVVKNEDPTAEEFDSHDLKREKVIAGGSEATILIGPLAPGRYSFMGEYHDATAQGVVVAK